MRKKILLLLTLAYLVPAQVKAADFIPDENYSVDNVNTESETYTTGTVTIRCIVDEDLSETDETLIVIANNKTESIAKRIDLLKANDYVASASLPIGEYTINVSFGGNDGSYSLYSSQESYVINADPSSITFAFGSKDFLAKVRSDWEEESEAISDKKVGADNSTVDESDNSALDNQSDSEQPEATETTIAVTSEDKSLLSGADNNKTTVTEMKEMKKKIITTGFLCVLLVVSAIAALIVAKKKNK